MRSLGLSCDASIWAHWSPSFHTRLSYLGPAPCFLVFVRRKPAAAGWKALFLLLDALWAQKLTFGGLKWWATVMPLFIDTAGDIPHLTAFWLGTQGTWAFLAQANELFPPQNSCSGNRITWKCSLRNRKWKGSYTVDPRWLSAGRGRKLPPLVPLSPQQLSLSSARPGHRQTRKLTGWVEERNRVWGLPISQLITDQVFTRVPGRCWEGFHSFVSFAPWHHPILPKLLLLLLLLHACVCVCVCVLSHFMSDFFADPWTVSRQVPLSTEFSRQE